MPYRRSSRSVDLEALRRVPDYVTPDVVVPPGLASIPAHHAAVGRLVLFLGSRSNQGPGKPVQQHRMEQQRKALPDVP